MSFGQNYLVLTFGSNSILRQNIELMAICYPMLANIVYNVMSVSESSMRPQFSALPTIDVLRHKFLY